MKKKIAVAVSLLLVLALSVGGTIAWLTDTSDTVVNTFTIGKVDIALTESGAEGTQGSLTKAYSGILPGASYAKDPTVSVDKDSEACWLFVKIEESNDNAWTDGTDSGKYVNYTVYNLATGDAVEGSWKPLAGIDNVYYMPVAKALASATEDKTFQVLAGAVGNDANGNSMANGKVTIDGEHYTTENAENLTLSLTFTAYAVQMSSFENNPTEAWAKLNP